MLRRLLLWLSWTAHSPAASVPIPPSYWLGARGATSGGSDAAVPGSLASQQLMSAGGEQFRRAASPTPALPPQVEDANGMRDADRRHRRGLPPRGAPDTRRVDELAFERAMPR